MTIKDLWKKIKEIWTIKEPQKKKKINKKK